MMSTKNFTRKLIAYCKTSPGCTIALPSLNLGRYAASSQWRKHRKVIGERFGVNICCESWKIVKHPLILGNIYIEVDKENYFMREMFDLFAGNFASKQGDRKVEQGEVQLKHTLKHRLSVQMIPFPMETEVSHFLM